MSEPRRPDYDEEQAIGMLISRMCHLSGVIALRADGVDKEYAKEDIHAHSVALAVMPRKELLQDLVHTHATLTALLHEFCVKEHERMMRP